MLGLVRDPHPPPHPALGYQLGFASAWAQTLAKYTTRKLELYSAREVRVEFAHCLCFPNASVANTANND